MILSLRNLFRVKDILQSIKFAPVLNEVWYTAIQAVVIYPTAFNLQYVNKSRKHLPPTTPPPPQFFFELI